MTKLKKSLPVFLLYIAVIFFTFITIGGEYLHSQIHDHEIHDLVEHECAHVHDHNNHADEPADGEHEDCPIFQLLVQGIIQVDSNSTIVQHSPQQANNLLQLAYYDLIPRFIIPSRGPPQIIS